MSSARLGWDGLGFIFRVHGQEFNSFRRRSRSKLLRDFQLRRQEKFLYTCGAIDLWEWEVRLLDLEEGADGDDAAMCLGGRGAAPPEHCGGPTGYAIQEYIEKAGLTSGPLFRPRLNSHSHKLGSQAMTPWTMWRTIESYLERLPGAMKDVLREDGTTCRAIRSTLPTRCARPLLPTARCRRGHY